MFQPAQKRTLLTVCLGLFMAFLDGTVVNLALPTIQRELVAIARAVSAGRPARAAERAERLAGILEHPVASG